MGCDVDLHPWRLLFTGINTHLFYVLYLYYIFTLSILYLYLHLHLYLYFVVGHAVAWIEQHCDRDSGRADRGEAT